jgi:hypothetical protein
VILVVCTTVPDLPWSAGRSLVDVQLPLAVVALVKCIVKVSEIACGLAACAGSATARRATPKRIVSLVLMLLSGVVVRYFVAWMTWRSVGPVAAPLP